MIQSKDTGIQVESTLTGETVAMSIDQSVMGHIMSVLTDMYSDPELAVLREYSSNAADAHVEAGVTRPPTPPARLDRAGGGRLREQPQAMRRKTTLPALPSKRGATVEAFDAARRQAFAKTFDENFNNRTTFRVPFFTRDPWDEAVLWIERTHEARTEWPWPARIET